MPGRGDEARVAAAFERYLGTEGWRIVTEHGNYADVIALRGTERLIAEAKGDTGSNAGLDVDTMFGQLLRRMEDSKATRRAVVVPSKVVPKVMRVPREALDRLGIEVYEVTDADEVVRVL